jgi:hypothetical protein
MKVWYSNPYSVEKNIGKALNDFCAMIPDDDFICLQDGDIMYLTSEWGRQIEHVARTAGKRYSLMGCLTNRLGRPIQRYKGEFSENFDIKHHALIAKELETNHWGEVEDITRKKRIAGMFMLFPKKLWNRIKFQENCIDFDDRFCQDILNAKGKLGLMKGLYVFHLYRCFSEVPHRDRSHLIKSE